MNSLENPLKSIFIGEIFSKSKIKVPNVYLKYIYIYI
jgi:hypothetical protein